MDIITLNMAKTKTVDFDELGITQNILIPFASGGGSQVITTDAQSIDAICKAFPADGNYMAKITVPDMGIMYVKPVCTLFEADGRFRSSHLDAYIVSGNTLQKFYARIIAYKQAETGEIVQLGVEVGFFA